MNDEQTRDKVATETPDLAAERVERLRELFPEAFTEGKVDFAKLRAALGDAADDRPERYLFTWAGKRDAIRILQTPSRATLVPCPEESVNFDTTQNLFIEGDNLEVLKLLYKPYFGRVKMIYIDPPYNTGNDFVYPDDYSDPLDTYLRLTGQKDAEGNVLTSNPETSGRFHSAWLSMMYPRLFLARQLLRDDGVIFVSIDDNEVHNLRMVMNEVFGEENFITTLIWNKQHSQQQGLFKRYHEYIVVYARSAMRLPNISGGDGEIEAGALKKISRANPASEFTFPPGVRFDAPDGTCLTGTFGDSEKVTVVKGRLMAAGGKTVEAVTLSAGWTQKDQMTHYFAGEEVIDTRGQRVLEFFFNSAGKLKCRKDRSRVTPPTLLPEYGMVSEQTGHLTELLGSSVFDSPKPVRMIRNFVEWFVKDGETVMDFFAGSGTSAEAALEATMQDGVPRRFILVQLPEPTPVDSEARKHGFETIAEIGKERIRRVIKKMKAESASNPTLPTRSTPEDLGFKVFKLSESNWRRWCGVQDATPDALVDQMEMFVDPLVEGWSPTNVLYEIALKEGYGLNCKIESRTVAGTTVYQVTDPDSQQSFLACLDAAIPEAVWKNLGLTMDTLFVCRDRALDDTAAANLALQCRLKTI